MGLKVSIACVWTCVSRPPSIIQHKPTDYYTRGRPRAPRVTTTITRNNYTFKLNNNAVYSKIALKVINIRVLSIIQKRPILLSFCLQIHAFSLSIEHLSNSGRIQCWGATGPLAPPCSYSTVSFKCPLYILRYVINARVFNHRLKS